MRLTLTWAASPSLLRAGGRSGGAAACARLGGRTGGRQSSAIAQRAPAAPTRLAKQFAPATTWLTTTQRWQRSGTGRPMGKGHQRLWQQAVQARRSGGVASVGTAGPPLCTEDRIMELDAPNVLMRPAALKQGGPASVLEHHTFWLSGTGKPTTCMAGTQTRSLSARTRRCTGSCKMSASWAWCTDGGHHHLVALERSLAPHSLLAWLCVLAIRWLCSAQRQQTCGTLCQMETSLLVMLPSSQTKLWPGRLQMAGSGSKKYMKFTSFVKEHQAKLHK